MAGHGPTEPIARPLRGPALLRSTLKLSSNVSLWRICEEAASRIAQLETDLERAKRYRPPRTTNRPL